MTINDYVSQVRTRLRQEPDDSSYTSPFIAQTLINNRSVLIKRDNKGSNTQSYQLLCLPLEESDFYDCDCVPDLGCKVYKSKCELPSVINKTRTGIRVLDGKQKLLEYVPVSKLRARTTIGINSAYYTIFDNRIVLFNAEYAVVFIKAIFADPIEISLYCGCNSSDSDCFDASSDDFPIDSYLVKPMIEMTIQDLTRSLTLPDDKINDANTN